LVALSLGALCGLGKNLGATVCPWAALASTVGSDRTHRGCYQLQTPAEATFFSTNCSKHVAFFGHMHQIKYVAAIKNSIKYHSNSYFTVAILLSM
jgi:hypothetical protein